MLQFTHLNNINLLFVLVCNKLFSLYQTEVKPRNSSLAILTISQPSIAEKPSIIKNQASRFKWLNLLYIY